MISEEDTHRTLLIHRVVFEDIYYRQGGESPVYSQLCWCLLCTFPSQFSLDTLRNSAAHADDTIITWSDPEIGTDIALSFQESVGCSLIWYGPALSRLKRLHITCGAVSAEMSLCSMPPSM